MKKHLLAIIIGVTTLSVYGCSGAKDAPSDAPKSADSTAPKSTDPSSPAKTAADADKKPDAVAKADSAKTPPAKPTLPTSDLPQNLKSDAYEYYGLSNTKDVNVELTDSVTKTVRHGVRRIALKEIKDGKATFEITYSGDLENQGVTSLSLGPDGISVLSSSMGTMKTKGYELPPKLGVGVTWNDSTNLDSDRGKLQISNSSKVVGREKVTTSVGTYDALVVESKGSGTVQGKPAKIEGKVWMAKGVGQVKQVITIKMEGQPAQTTTMVEAK